MRIVKRLGGGASAGVWLVERAGCLVALKLAAASHGETILNEARAALCLSDPALPALLGVGRLDANLASDPQLQGQGVEGASIYSLWEHLPGVDADQLPALSSRQVAWILRDVSRALSRLHASDLSHGDVKPANMRADTTAQRAWLFDFGLSINIQVDMPRGVTPRYLDPSLLGSNGRQRDLYALGLSLLELLRPELRELSAPLDRLRHELEHPAEPARIKRRAQDELRARLLELANQLVHEQPGRRPHAHWLWREASRLLAEPDPDLVPDPDRVAASYLALRQDDIFWAATTGASLQLTDPALGWVAPRLSIARSIVQLRAELAPAQRAAAPERVKRLSAQLAADLAAPEPESAGGEQLTLEPLDTSGARRWLVHLIGAEAAGFPELGLDEGALAERLIDYCTRFPVATIGARELAGDARPPAIPDSLQTLALGLQARPSAAALAAGEQLVAGAAPNTVEPALRVALAAALRRRGEYRRAQAVLEVEHRDPQCVAELAECQRRGGQLREAIATCQRALRQLADEPQSTARRGSAEARARATWARAALSLGEADQAERALATTGPVFHSHEAHALLSMGLAAGQFSQTERWIARAELTARGDEERARAAGLRGYFAHSRGAAAQACVAFEAAVELAGHAGSLPEEATYLTGLAAAASDAGRLGQAVAAAERASLMFERWGAQGQAARAQLNLGAALIGCGAWSHAADALARAADLASRSADSACGRMSLISLAELYIARLTPQASHPSADAESAVQALSRASAGLPEPGGVERLLLGSLSLRLEHALVGLPGPTPLPPSSALTPVDVADLDTLARDPELPLGARLDWWRSRAEQLSARGSAATPEPGAGRADAVLRELVGLASAPGPVMSRGPACFAGAALAARLSRGDEARRLTLAANTCAREALHNIPQEYQDAARQLPWLARGASTEAGADPNQVELAAAQLAKLEQTIRSLGERASLRTLLNQVLDALVLWTGVERGLLLLRAPEGRLKVRAARNLSREDLTPDQHELSMSLAKRALSAREPVVAVDALGELPEHTESVHALNLRSVLAVPLIARGEVLGVVYLDDRERRGAFGQQELAWVRLLGSVAAIAIAEARDQLWLRRAARRAERAAARLSQALSTEHRQLLAAKLELGARAHPEIIGDSPALRELLRLVSKVASTDLPVLILGASGTGKELIARAIHADSPRAELAFVAENCAAVPETLLESTLFGHVRGAFTGADRGRVGLFELADGGTLFLDEIGEMSLGMQAKLLRVLERGEVRPVGANKTKRVSVRTVAATHRDLPALVKTGEFREDLYYRLEVFTLRVPSLAERKTDIRLLTEHFIRQHSAAGTRPRLTTSALSALEQFSWPGNVRQLENEVRRALVLCDGDLRPEHFSREVAEPNGAPTLDLKQATERVERRLLAEALEQTHGNQTRAAKLLGVSRFGLQKMLKRLDLAPAKP